MESPAVPAVPAPPAAPAPPAVPGVAVPAVPAVPSIASVPSIAAVPAPAPRRSRAVRAVLLVVGTIALGLGVLGIVIPVLPTTPFLLLAAACYARASERLYLWLLNQPTLGPVIVRWRESRTMDPRVKLRALVVVLVTFTLSIILVEEVVMRALLALTGTIVSVFLARIPAHRASAG